MAKPEHPVTKLKSQASSENNASLTPHVLIIDDEELICQQLDHLYSYNGFRVTVATSAEQGLQVLDRADVDLVVTDIRLSGLSGIALTERIQESWPEVPVIAISGHADIGAAVNILKSGASDYIVKPFSAATILESTRVLLKKAQVFTEIRHLRQTLKEKCEFGGMLSTRPEMHRVFEIIRLVSHTDTTVVVEGETGTGKELVASAIHQQSRRRSGPFITINCGGLPETLLESELFGYERGAFTGADRSRPGKLELAQGGTVFLDEIENVTPMMQAKLLLVLQDGRVQRLGSGQWMHVDMRVIAATNVPLKDLVARGQMRRDFYHRINVIPIRLIPLRQRAEDIPLLVQDYLRNHPVAVQKKITKLSPQAMEELMAYHWPGNIRELQNVLEKAMVLATSRIIEKVDLYDDAVEPVTQNQTHASLELPLLAWVREQEKHYISRKLDMCKGRIDITAKSCGVDVRTIYRKMQQYGLDKKVYRGKRRPFPHTEKTPPNKMVS